MLLCIFTHVLSGLGFKRKKGYLVLKKTEYFNSIPLNL